MLLVRTTLVAAFAVGPLLMASTPADAEDSISYTCDSLTQMKKAEPFIGVGRGNCVASKGAPSVGMIDTAFVVKSSDGTTTYSCAASKDGKTPAGSVSVPAGVEGNTCKVLTS